MTDHDRPSLHELIRTRSSSGGTSLADAVRDAIVHAIDTGRYRAGEQLREIDLAAALGVSRTPVREALHRLEVEGLLVKRDRGLIVPVVDDRQILELYAMREVLEGTAAGLAARSASDSEIYSIGQILALSADADSGTPERQASLNSEYHSAIARAANNRYLCKSLFHLRDAVMRLSDTTFALAGRPKVALREHRAIYRAIQRHEAETAEALARLHIREALRCRMTLLHQRRQNQLKISA
jgi:DNA-binding GntR family transcriptional regulator